MKKLFFVLILSLSAHMLWSQSTFIPYNRDYYHLIDRFQIRYSGRENIIQTSFKPIRRIELANFLETLKEEYQNMSPQDQFNYEFLMNDNWRYTGSEYNKNPKHWWNLAYERKSDLFVYESGDSYVRINPAMTFTVGKETDSDELLYTNTRGIEAQGVIDNKIGFYTLLTTSQSQFPGYVYDRAFPNGALAHEASWKKFGDTGLDYFHVRGYFTFNLTKSIDVQAGYDKQFIGNGLRSMIMSDFSSPFLFAKINTRVGRLTYTNLFSQMTSDIIFNQGFPEEGNYPTKFFAMHRIGVDVNSRLTIGLSEYIVSQKSEIEYFNPIIFLRAVELFQGSPANVLISMDAKYDWNKKLRIYGQLIFDDFEIDALRSGDKGWEIKFGTQLGVEYFDAFDIQNLDLQLETNISRPYFYAHEEPQMSYTNARNPLAHPMGSNFKEIILAGRYQPLPKLFVQGKLIRTSYGEDRDDLNFGGNPLLDTDTRIGQTGIEIGQGVSTTNTYLELTGSYMLLHNVFLDWKNVYRKKDSEIEARSSNTFITMLSLRWNLPQREHEF